MEKKENETTGEVLLQFYENIRCCYSVELYGLFKEQADVKYVTNFHICVIISFMKF